MIFYFISFCNILEKYYSNVIQQYGKNLTYVMFWADIARLLQHCNNIINSFWNIIEILLYFYSIV